MNNIVKNLQTKDNLTYELAYNHLMDLRSSSSTATVETVYKASTQPKVKPSQDGTEVYSYCQKRGHMWSEYHARKRREKNNKDENKKNEKAGKQAKIANVDAGKDESETALTVVRPSSNSSTFPVWVLDSGATSYMTSNPDYFTHINENNSYIKIGDGSRIKIEGIGDVKLRLGPQSDGSPTIVLRDCLYIPSLGKLSLLSVRKCQENGLHIVGRDDVLEVRKPNGTIIYHGKDVGNGLFELQLHHDAPHHDEHAMIMYRQWHNALGHPAFIAQMLCTDGNLIPSRPSDFYCKECSLAKSINQKPAKLKSKSSTRPLEFVDMDLSGKFSNQSLGKGLYYITFIDDYTRYAWVRIHKTKDKALGAIRDFVAMVEHQFTLKVTRFRCDGGGEYIGKAARAELSAIGIVLEVTLPYSPESNSVAERYN